MNEEKDEIPGGSFVGCQKSSPSCILQPGDQAPPGKVRFRKEQT